MVYIVAGNFYSQAVVLDGDASQWRLQDGLFVIHSEIQYVHGLELDFAGTSDFLISAVVTINILRYCCPLLSQGYYFLMAAYCSFCIHFRTVDDASSSLKPYFVEPSVTFCFITWVLFEVCFPIAFLVSSIVTFVLIPHAKKANLPTDNFYVIIPLIMHNANILFMALEIIANQIPFSVWHFPFLWIYGIAYCVFSWIWNHYHGYYFYFFLDYTRPGAIVWYIALLSIVGLFFSVGFGASYLMITHGDSYVPAFVSHIVFSMDGLLFLLYQND